ncbi:hypothetical protein N5D77_22940 [Comamonas thiooxydans]|uniref:Uncharacterized protein n=1 Tax=Comamonas thiooxydans TaxID=363952 RepID=A0AA42TRF9_9BURK|nr:hypothetical protein [Comamonas thiooxydans]MDH1337037.1 hypothetical protein [Comamonas thiooxydans]MDH1743198.1 hypothetical protein [Comamonas thiooxydans]MDH1789438.1 hypothetical protein [Comamonas thiooxydans]
MSQITINFLSATFGWLFHSLIKLLMLRLAKPSVLRFIELLNERFELLNEGALADTFGEIQLTPAAQARYQRIDRELMELAHFIYGSVSGKNH